MFYYSSKFHSRNFFLDVAMPVIEQKTESQSLRRIINATVTLDCQIRGQAGMEVSWYRDGLRLQKSPFEKIKTEYPTELIISAVTKTQLSITYRNDRDIYDNLHCTENRNNTRRLLCKSIYSCSASYPNASNQSQGNILLTVTPDIGNTVNMVFVQTFLSLSCHHHHAYP